MCRFIGYLGKHPIALHTLLDHYENSLVNQSRRARETKTGLNADGFGVGWYDLSLTPIPAVFKSTRPAWNDQNLRSIAATVCSTCFIGHVRASTVGDVSLPNCHPFLFDHTLSAHNGTVLHFREIQRDLCNLLHEEDFFAVSGQTDSEHLSALISTNLRGVSDPTINDYEAAIREAIQQVHTLQRKKGVAPIIRANLLYTDGSNLIALRYGTDPEKQPWSMYYSTVDVLERSSLPQFKGAREIGSGVVIASEMLTEGPGEWSQILPNSFFRVDKDLGISMSKFDPAIAP